jgi:hypothetical protein
MLAEKEDKDTHTKQVREGLYTVETHQSGAQGC